MSGMVILMGSGELAPRLVKVHRAGIEAAQAESVTIIDTPYGFQENADQLTERIVEFFATSLAIDTEVASLRSLDASDADRERFRAAVRNATYVFAGPGSPTYALRVWQASGLREPLLGVVRSGGTVTFASAAALTAGIATIPIYEIYKVGLDPFWLEGLDLLGSLGVRCVVVPHWNNAEGGTHDTSRCYIGERRLATLEQELAEGILGVDEHTAATIDFGASELRVEGAGAVTLRRGGAIELRTGESMPLTRAAELLAAGPPPIAIDEVLESGRSDVADDAAPHDLLAQVLAAEEASRMQGGDRAAFRSLLVEIVARAEAASVDLGGLVGGFVEALLVLRDRERVEGRYESADAIRDRLLELGVEVRDGPNGSEWVLKSDT